MTWQPRLLQGEGLPGQKPLKLKSQQQRSLRGETSVLTAFGLSIVSGRSSAPLEFPKHPKKHLHLRGKGFGLVHCGQRDQRHPSKQALSLLKPGWQRKSWNYGRSGPLLREWRKKRHKQLSSRLRNVWSSRSPPSLLLPALPQRTVRPVPSLQPRRSWWLP